MKKRDRLPLAVCIDRLHDLPDLCLAGFASHLQEHRPDHFFVDRRVLLQFLFEFTFCEIESQYSPDDQAYKGKSDRRPEIHVRTPFLLPLFYRSTECNTTENLCEISHNLMTSVPWARYGSSV